MKVRILIVDDSDIIRSVVKKALCMAGLDIGAVFEASDGIEALDVLSDKWVDVVFADINMPRMDGIELVRRLKGDPMTNEIPVVIISSDQNQNKLDAVNELGVSGYVKKPFHPEDFKQIIGRLFP